MADNITITQGTGTTIATDDCATVHYSKTKLVDGTADSTTVIAADVGAKANALRVAPANDITDATYIGDIKFGEAEPNSAAIKAAVEIMDDWDDANYCNVNMNVAGTDVAANAGILNAQTIRVTIATDDECNNLLGTIDADTGAIKTAVEIIDNAISGNEMQVDVVAALPAGTNAIGKLAANTGVDIGDVDVTSITNMHSADYDSGAGTDTTLAIGIAVPASGGAAVVPGDSTDGLKVQEKNSAAIKTAVELIDNAVSGNEIQVDVVAALPAGTNAIGKLAANSGVDIGDVDILSIAAGDNNIGNVDIVSLPASTNTIEVVGDVAENAVAAGNPVLVGGRYDATPRTLGDTDAGAIALDADGAVHIADGGNTITIDGTITANLSATDNAVLDQIELNTDPLLVVGGGTEATAIRVTIANDSTGVLSVDDGGGALTVDGTITANLSATDNAVLDVIAGDTTSLDGKVTACNTGAVVLAAGTASIGKLAANTGVDIGDVDVTSIVPGTAATNLGKARDSALGATDTGVMALAVRDDTLTTLTPADGDYVPLRVNSTGALHVTGAGGGTQYAEDATHSSGATGTFALVVRKDTAAQLAGTDGDYSGLVNDANGRLHVISSSRAKSVEAITDWTAVAQNAVGESGTIDCSGHDGTSLLIQAFLDTTTAHTGTKFKVQVSSNTTGNEDWHDYREFTALAGTAATDLIEDNPLAAGSTSLTLTTHALTTEAIWIGIEDGTLANSELIFVASQSANAVVALDGTTNAHVQNTAVFNVAISKVVILDATVNRARVIVDNTYDDNGSTLNYKVRATKLTR